MAGRTRSASLTDAEHRIMRVLWEHPRSTVGEVVERMAGPRRPAYNSVLTILRILERKGYVSHEKDGRAFIYSPVIDKRQARTSALTHVLSRFFDGSREALVLDLFGEADVDAVEVEKVKSILERHTTQSSGTRGSR